MPASGGDYCTSLCATHNIQQRRLYTLCTYPTAYRHALHLATYAAVLALLRRLELAIAEAAWLDAWVGVDSPGVEIYSWTRAPDGR